MAEDKFEGIVTMDDAISGALEHYSNWVSTINPDDCEPGEYDYYQQCEALLTDLLYRRVYEVWDGSDCIEFPTFEKAKVWYDTQIKIHGDSPDFSLEMSMILI